MHSYCRSSNCLRSLVPENKLIQIKSNSVKILNATQNIRSYTDKMKNERRKSVCISVRNLENIRSFLNTSLFFFLHLSFQVVYFPNGRYCQPTCMEARSCFFLLMFWLWPRLYFLCNIVDSAFCSVQGSGGSEAGWTERMRRRRRCGAEETSISQTRYKPKRSNSRVIDEHGC